MRAFLLIGCRFALILMIGAALSSVSFAHQVSKPDAQMAAFLQAGGTLDDICGEADDHVAHPPGCEACRIVDAVLALSLDARVAAKGLAPGRWLLPSAQVASLPRDPAHPGRAPPVV